MIVKISLYEDPLDIAAVRITTFNLPYGGTVEDEIAKYFDEFIEPMNQMAIDHLRNRIRLEYGLNDNDEIEE